MSVLAIVGASGHGRVIAEAAQRSGWDTIVFFDDSFSSSRPILHWDLVGDTGALLHNLTAFDGVVIAIGDNKKRVEFANIFISAGGSLATIIYPAAIVSRYSTIEPGTVILAGAVINGGCKIGANCIINTNATVEHDCILEDGVHVSLSASMAGEVRVGKLSWIGVGACILQQIRIGEHVIVAAGAVVISNIQDNCTVIGIPAKILHTPLREPAQQVFTHGGKH